MNEPHRPAPKHVYDWDDELPEEELALADEQVRPNVVVGRHGPSPEPVPQDLPGRTTLSGHETTTPAPLLKRLGGLFRR